ncbi:MAG: hypothetical protein WD492_10305 [Alkalispirochaeta sp.]
MDVDQLTIGNTSAVGDGGGTGAVDFDGVVDVGTNATVRATAAVTIAADFTATNTATFRSGDLNVSGGTTQADTLLLYTIDGTTPMNLGTSAAGNWELTDAEIDRLSAGTSWEVGEASGGTTPQSGQIRFRSVTLPAGLADIPLQIASDDTTGAVYFDDEGSATALATGGSAPITILTGTGGVTANANDGNAELGTTGTISITSAGAVGSASNRLSFVVGQDKLSVDTSANGSNVFLHGLGALTLGTGAAANTAVTTGTGAGGVVNVTTAAGNLSLAGLVTAGSGAVTLNPAADIVLDYDASASGDVITTDSSAISLQRPVVLAADGQLTSSSGPITFNGNVSESAASTLTVGAGTGDINLNLDSVVTSGAQSWTAANVNVDAQTGADPRLTLQTSGTDITVTTTGSLSIADDDDLTIDTGSGAGNIVLDAVTGVAAMGADKDITLRAGTGTVTLDGAVGDETLIRDLLVRADDLAITGTGSIAIAGALSFYTESGTVAMNVGSDAGAGSWDLDDAEIGRLGAADSITIGEATVQGDGPVQTTVTTADFSGVTGLTSLTFLANAAGSGATISIVDSDDANETIGLNSGDANLTIRAAGKIEGRHYRYQLDPDAAVADISTNGTIILESSAGPGEIGDDPEATGFTADTDPGALQIAALTNTVVDIDDAPGGVWLEGIGGEINLGTVAATVGPIWLNVFEADGFIRLTDDVSTNAQNIVFSRPVRVDEPGITVSTGVGGGDIDFTETLDSQDDGAGIGEGNDLTLIAGNGNVFFRGAVGRNGSGFGAGSGFDDPAMGTITISSAADVLVDAGVTTAVGTSAQGADLLVTHTGTFTISDTTSDADQADFDLDLEGVFTQSGTGGTSIAGDIRTAAGAVSFAGPLTLTGNVAVDTSAGADITFGDDATIDDGAGGPWDLRVDAPGSLVRHGATNGAANGRIGGGSGTARIGNLEIVDAATVTFDGEVFATSLTQTAGGTLTTFNQPVDVAGPVDLNGQDFTVNAGLTTAGGGTMTVTNAGTLTIADTTGTGDIGTVDLNLDGAFDQDGGGGVSLAGDIATTPDSVDFAGPVTLTGDVLIDTGTGANIAFGNSATIDGAWDLTVDAPGNTVSFGATSGATNGRIGGAGGANRLDAVTITDADTVTFNGELFATSLTQTAGSTLTTFHQPVDVAGPVDLNGEAFAVDAGLTTTSGGTMTVTNAGTLTITDTTGTGDIGTVDLNLDGAFDQDGGGGVSLAGDIATTGDSVEFAGPVTLTGDVLIDTGTGANIAFGNSATIDGAWDLTVDAPGNTVSFGATSGATNGRIGGAGGANRLDAVTITDADTVTFNGELFATSLTQTAGSTLTTFNQPVDVAGPVDLNGEAFTVNAGLTTSAGGTMTVTNAGTLTIVDTWDPSNDGIGDAEALGDQGDFDLDLDGSFSQDGSGGVSIAGDIRTAAGAVSFAGPLTLTGSVSIDTSAGANITFGDSATIADGAGGPWDLRLDAPGSLIRHGATDAAASGRIGGDGGVNRIGDLEIVDAGTVTFNGELFVTNLVQTAGTGPTTFFRNGDLATDGDVVTQGTITIDQDSTITFGEDLVIRSTGAGNGVLVDGPIDASGATGNLRVSAEGTDGDVTVNADIGGGSEHMSVIADRNIDLAATVDVSTSTSGTLDLEATSGSVTMADDSRLIAVDGDIRILSGTDVTLGGVATTNGSVSITATSGNILDGGDMDTDVAAVGLRFEAGTGLGTDGTTVNAIDTSVGTVSGRATSGGIYIAEANGITVGDTSATVQRVASDATTSVVTDATRADLRTTGGDGDIVLVSATGTVTLDDGTVLADGAVGTDNTAVSADGAGGVRLEAVAGTVSAAASVVSSTGHVTISAGTNVALEAGVDVATGTPGTVYVEAGGGTIGMDGTSSIDATGSSALLQSTGTATIGDVAATDVSIRSTGAGIVNAADSSMNVDATNLRLEASGDIGAGSRPISTTVSRVTALSAGGSIYLEEADGIEVNTVRVEANEFNSNGTTQLQSVAAQSDLRTETAGNIVLETTTGDLLLNDGDGAVDQTGGDGREADGNAVVASTGGRIRLAALDSGGGITGNADVRSGSGSISVIAGDSIDLVGGVTVMTGTTGTLDLEATAGSITMADDSRVTAVDGDIRFLADVDITLGGIATTTGSVSATATNGNILDGGDTDTDIAAEGLRFEAGTGFGNDGTTVNAIDTSVTTVSGRATGGGIYIAEADGIAVGDTTATVQRVAADATTSGVTDATRADLRTTAGDGSIVVRTTDGAITLNDGTVLANGSAGTDNTAVSANGSGNLLIEAGGTGQGVIANANILSGSGNVSVIAAAGVDLAATVDVTTGTTGTLDLEATAGSITMADDSRVTAVDGDIRLLADVDITLGRVATTNGTVSLTATSGNILDGGDTDTDIAAEGLRFEAGTGFGNDGTTVDAIDTSVTTVSGRATSGGIYIVEADGITVDDASATVQRVASDGTSSGVPDTTQSDLRTSGGDGSIVLRTTNGTIILNDGTAGSDNTAVSANGSGNLLIEAGGTGQDITANADVLSGSGNISVIAAAGVSLAATVDVTTGITGTLDLEATSGSVTMADDSRLTAVDGDIRILAGTDVSLGGVATSNGSVSITATSGNILDGGDTDTDIAAEGLRFEAGTGFGNDGTTVDAIDTSVTTVSGRATSGGIYIVEADGITVDDASATVQRVASDATTSAVTDATRADLRTTAGSGSIVVRTTDGTITLNDGTVLADGSAGTDNTAVSANGSGNILVQAQGTGQDITANADLLSGSGNVSVIAADNLDLGATVDVTTGITGTLDLEATAGSITMADDSRVTAADGDIRLLAEVDVTLGGVATTNGSVSVTATSGDILDGGDTDTDIAAVGLRFEAGTGFGNDGTTVDAIDTNVTTVSGRATSGGIYIAEADGITVGDTSATVQRVAADATTSGVTDATQSDLRTTTGNGSIELVAAGAISLNDGTAPNDQTAVSADGSGTIELTATAGTMTLSAALQSGSGTIALDGDSITQNEDGDITTGGAGTISVTADVASITMIDGAVTQSGDGSITYTAENDLTVGEIVSSNGDVALTASSGDLIAQSTPPGTPVRSEPVSEVNTAGVITLSAADRIGGPTESAADDPDPSDGPMQIRTGHAEVDVLQAPGGVWLEGVGGELVMGEIGANTGSVTLTIFDGIRFIRLTQNITTSGSDIVFQRPVRVDVAGLTVSTGTGAGDIDFTETLDSEDGEGNDLTLVAGNGDVFLRGAVGRDGSGFDADGVAGFANPAMGSITVSSATDVLIDAGMTTAAGTSGQGADLDIIHTGTLTISDTDGETDRDDFDLDLEGYFAQNGAGSVSIAGDIRTDGAAITFNGPMTLTGNLRLSTGTSALGTITIKNSVASAAAESLEMEAGSGDVVVDAQVTVAGGISSTGNNFSTSPAATLRTADGTGPISINHSGTVTVQAAVTSADGSVAITSTGAAVSIDAPIETTAGQVSVDSSSGTTLSAVSDIQTTGGSADVLFGSSGSGALTTAADISAGGSVLFNRDVSLSGPVTWTAGGTLTANGAIDGAQDLTLVTDGATRFRGAVGSSQPPTSLSITNVSRLVVEGTAPITVSGPFTQIDSSGSGEGIVILGADLDTSAADGTIRLDGTLYVAPGYPGAPGSNSVTIDAGTAAIGPFDTGAGGTRDAMIVAPGSSPAVAIRSNATFDSFVLYNGSLELSDGVDAVDMNLTGDLVLLGGGYTPDDSNLTPDGVGYFRYDAPARRSEDTENNWADPSIELIVTLPGAVEDGAAGWQSWSTPDDGSDYTGAVTSTSLNGNTITVGKNFYANGLDLMGAGSWDLKLQTDPGDASAAFAEFYYGEIDNVSVTDGSGNTGSHWVAAAEPDYDVFRTTDTDADHDAPDGNGNNVSSNETASGAAGTSGVDFTRAVLVRSGTYTVYDNVIQLEFTKPIENSKNEISRAIGTGFIQIDDDTRTVTGTWIDAEATDPTDGEGDLSVFYISVDPADRWNTDATGASPGDDNSTDRGRTGEPPAYSGVTPNITFPRATALVWSLWRDHHGNRVLGTDQLFELSDNNVSPLVDEDSDGNRIYGEYNADGSYIATGDQTSPVLVQVTAGRAPYNQDGADLATLRNDTTVLRPYDSHNFFHLRYSEPVEIVGAAGLEFSDLSGGTAAGHDEASIVRGTTTLGHFSESGSTVSLSGLLHYPGDGEMTVGTRDGEPSGTAILRDNSNGENPNEAHGMTLFIQGFSRVQGSQRYWPGYMANAADPLGRPITNVPENSQVRDREGNEVEYSGGPWDTAEPARGEGFLRRYGHDGNELTIAGSVETVREDDTGYSGEWLSGWDVDPPTFSTFQDDDDPENRRYEIVTRATTLTNLVNRLEFHVLDNQSIDLSQAPDPGNPVDGTEPEYWDPENLADASDPEASDYTHPNRRVFADARIQEGIRDTSADFPDAWEPTPLDEYLAFRIEQVAGTSGDPDLELVNTYNLGIDTEVNNSLYTIDQPINVPNDSYLTLQIQDSGHFWGLLTDIWVSYNQDEAYLTDLAGNLLPSFGPMKAIERTPPRIEVALAEIGNNRVYLKFTEPVYGDADNTSQLGTGALEITGGPNTYTIDDVEPLDLRSDGVSAEEFFVTLNNELAAEDLFAGFIRPTGSDTVFDGASNAMPGNDRRRVSDIALNAINPIWATDSYGLSNTGDLGAGNFRTIRTFDGTASQLSSSDITLQGRLTSGIPSGLPVGLIYDLNVPDSVKVGDYWSPNRLFGFIEETNDDARAVNPFEVDGDLRTFMIPGSDPEIEEGGMLEFQFSIGNISAARLLEADDPRTVAPWKLDVGVGMIPQRANVTILNNVIYPERGENTVLVYEVDRPGLVTINVFTLDGNVVRTLQRGRQGTGDYRVAWDGTNNSGSIVARGIYFVRVVAPGVDEYRKVIIAK